MNPNKFLKKKVNKKKEIIHKHVTIKSVDNLDVTEKIFEGYTPSQIVSAYNIPTYIKKSNKTATVTIIIAYTYPDLQKDFDTFCIKFNLPQQKLNIITLGTLQDAGWASEECLDVQMVHVANPYADITVIEAKSNSYNDMNYAVDYANKLPETQIISMSWGSEEFNAQRSNDKYFSNNKICYCASSGDENFVCYPSSSPNVISVGGTTLILNNLNTRESEKTWPSAGSGISKYSAIPNYQSGCKNISGTKRLIPDISCIANPNYGVQICYNNSYYIFGGTSVSAPLFAGMLSIVNQKRIDSNLTTLTSVSTAKKNLFQKYIYKDLYNQSFKNKSYLYTNNFYDITIGKDGNYNATKYYDKATGLGVPICSSLINTLINA
jgi:subtilase family serine protease